MCVDDPELREMKMEWNERKNDQIRIKIRMNVGPGKGGSNLIRKGLGE